jgi:hypothetical protein
MKVLDGEMIQERKVEKAIESAFNSKLDYTKSIPPGYLPISLSSEGSFGVPKKVWIKNFSTEDTLHLSMASEDLLPDFLISVMNKNIWNPDNSINVANWTENQITELLIKLYANYYGSVIEDINFPVTEEDYEYLKKEGDSEALKKLDSGWLPKTNLELKNIEFVDLETPIKEAIKISKKGEFEIIFSIPRFGDILTLRKIIREHFFIQDKKYEKLQRTFDENPDAVSLTDISEMENYYIEKSLFITRLTKCYYIVEMDKEKMAEKSYKEKMKLSEDPRLDATMFKRYEKELNKLQYGIKPEVKVMNPFTHQYCTRRFVFRPFNILQIIFLSEFDEYDVSYE